MEKEVNNLLKMRCITVIHILFVASFVASCQHVDIRKKMQDDYRQSVQFFNSELVSHFPDKLPDSCSFGATVPKKDTLKMLGFGVDGILLWKSYQEEEFITLQKDYLNRAKNIYPANDSSLLLVFSYCDVINIEGRTFEDQEPPERQKLARHNVTTASSLPVPLFEIDDYKGNTISGLTDDFKLYVIDAKPGKYIDEKYLQKCDCLPENWQNGYSKGVALSDEKQVVIYWVIVW